MKPFNFAIVVSRFNSTVTEKLLLGAKERCQSLNIPGHCIDVFPVPGAVEIPVTAQALAKKNKYDAVICLGAVIRGETTHYDYVCEQVSYGCQRVALDHQLPVIFGVLTTENEAQAFDRLGGKHGHKGKEAVDAAVEMAKTLQLIRQ